MTCKFLQAFRLSNKVLLVFEHEIFVLDSDPVKNNFEPLGKEKEYHLTLNLITYATLN